MSERFPQDADGEEAAVPAASGAEERLRSAFSGWHRDPPRDAYELRCLIDDLKAKQRRGRLTLPTYLAGVLFFATSGFVTGNLPPAVILGGLCGVGAWATWLFRRNRRGRIAAMEARHDALAPGRSPLRGASDAAPGRARDG